MRWKKNLYLGVQNLKVTRKKELTWKAQARPLVLSRRQRFYRNRVLSGLCKFTESKLDKDVFCIRMRTHVLKFFIKQKCTNFRKLGEHTEVYQIHQERKAGELQQSLTQICTKVPMTTILEYWQRKLYLQQKCGAGPLSNACCALKFEGEELNTAGVQ